MKLECRYLRVLVTNRCNMTCFYCHQEGILLNNRTHQEMSVDEIETYVKLLTRVGFRKIKLMGGEPTLRKDLPEIIRRVSCLPDIEDLSMITNGIALSRMVESYQEAGLSRINVSIHGWGLNRFQQITGLTAHLHEVRRSGIEKLISLGYQPKLNFVLTGGDDNVWDDLSDLIDFAGQHFLVVNILDMIVPPGTEEKLGPHAILPADILQRLRPLGIAQWRDQDRNSPLDPIRLQLGNGAILEIKTTRLADIAPFNLCEGCKVKHHCTEGIFAFRLTESGVLQPCLVHANHQFPLRERFHHLGPEACRVELMEYLEYI